MVGSDNLLFERLKQMRNSIDDIETTRKVGLMRRE